MVRFTCSSCSYEFAPRNKDVTAPPFRCPYCGTEGAVSEKGHILEDL